MTDDLTITSAAIDEALAAARAAASQIEANQFDDPIDIVFVIDGTNDFDLLRLIFGVARPGGAQQRQSDGELGERTIAGHVVDRVHSLDLVSCFMFRARSNDVSL